MIHKKLFPFQDYNNNHALHIYKGCHLAAFIVKVYFE